MTLQRGNNVEWSDAVLLSGLSVKLNFVVLRFFPRCYWSSTDLPHFQSHRSTKVNLSSFHTFLRRMVLILAASSSPNSLRKIPAPSEQRVEETCFTKSGLTLNLIFNARGPRKKKRFNTTGIFVSHIVVIA